MNIQSYFKSLKKEVKIIDTLLEYTTIKPFPNYPFHDYIGINFTTENITSLKFYFGFFQPITKELSDIFLNQHEELNEYLPYWMPTKERTIENTGFTFTLKLNNKFEITKGFHFRFPYSKKNNFPETQQFKLISEDLMNVGINFEYKNHKTVPKYYYYFHKEHNRQKFALRYKQPFIAGSDLIEYTESEHFNKLIAWNVSNNKFFEIFQKNSEWQIQKEICTAIAEKTNYHNKSFYGFYDNDLVRSMYYMNYKQDNSVAFPGSSPLNFQVFTIKDFIENYLK